MFASVATDIRREFTKGNTVTQLIILNVAIWVLVLLLSLFLRLYDGASRELYNEMMHWLMLSSDPLEAITKFWTFITHMFLHEGLFHILWNMLILYWFGRIVGDLIGDRHILPLYILGGLTGGLLYILGTSVIYDSTVYALGASGAVMAIVLAAGFLAPDYRMNLLLIGPVRLKFIVLGILLLDLAGIANNINTGGHIAHLGGALWGWFYIMNLREGIDFSVAIEKWTSGLFSSKKNKKQKKRKSQLKVIKNTPETRSRNKAKKEPKRARQEEIDRILEKISNKGFDSLSDTEKETLYQASKKHE